MNKTQLLIESGVTVNFQQTSLTESIIAKRLPSGCLLLKGVPATILNKTNANGRIYTREEIEKSLIVCKSKNLFDDKALTCTADDHPTTSHVKPTHTSHVVVNAYVENINGDQVLMNDWLILDTNQGKNLQSLILNGVAVGTSIRGLGNVNESGSVEDYQYLGTDVVGQPSSGTYTASSKSYNIELTNESLIFMNHYIKENEDPTSNTGTTIRNQDNKVNKEIKIHDNDQEILNQRPNEFDTDNNYQSVDGVVPEDESTDDSEKQYPSVASTMESNRRLLARNKLTIEARDLNNKYNKSLSVIESISNRYLKLENAYISKNNKLVEYKKAIRYLADRCVTIESTLKKIVKGSHKMAINFLKLESQRKVSLKNTLIENKLMSDMTTVITKSTKSHSNRKLDESKKQYFRTLGSVVTPDQNKY